MIAWTLLRRGEVKKDGSELEDQSPLRLWSAIQMGVALQLVLMTITYVRETWGSPGIIASAAVLGLTDVDALTLSMNRMGTSVELVELAARAIAVGILANTILKMTLAVVLGSRGYRWRTAMGLAALALATIGGLWLQR